MIPLSKTSADAPKSAPPIVKATGEESLFQVGDFVKVLVRYPVGHYRVPHFIRGKRGSVEMLIEPRAVNNEEEGFGRNAGLKGYYYRVAIPLTELWPGYDGSPQDGLRIEIYETWLERI
jgi:nitrile hydratase